MNLRIGAFGRQEGVSAVWIAMFVSGCFAIDNRAAFADGNASCLTYAIASLLSLLLFECALRGIRRRHGNDLNALIGRSKAKALLAVLSAAALLIAAMQPLEHFLVTVTQYVFVEAKQTDVCLYLLPALVLLTVLGAETLVRTSRIFLPMLCLSFAAAMLLAIPQYRLYRLYPFPLGSPYKLVSDSVCTLSRTFSPLLALLCIGEGTQNTGALRSVGRIGAAFGACMTVAALFGLGMSFSYLQLKEMPSPFYRLLVEVRTENPTMRLDRATLFLWLSAALLTSAFYLFSAGALLAKTFAVRDVRPIVCALCALAVTLILVLYYDSETTLQILRFLYRWAWIPAIVPIPFLLIGKRREGSACGSVSHC